jgi:hypothetical protein
MRRLSLIVPAALAAAVFFIGGEQFATSDPRLPPAIHSNRQVETGAVNHGAAVQTYFAGTFSGMVFEGERVTPLGSPVKVTCPATTACTVEIDNVIQMGGGDAPANRWAVWETQGEHRSVPGGPWMGLIPTHGWVTGSEIEMLNGVPPGRHAIQPLVYSLRGGKVFSYMIVIRVYAP